MPNSASAFSDEIALHSGQNVNACFQCKKCTCGCPVAYTMDITPTQTIHAVRLGMRDMVLNSRTIWLCASCETCTTRCPQEVDVAKVMDAARIVARRNKVRPAVPAVPAFYRTALGSIKYLGRMYEIGIVMLLKVLTRAYTQDLKLGLLMMRKRKMSLLPSFRGAGAARRLFNKISKLESS